ncbi:hypothetical protein L2750_03825 [Shewanella submarina]|uniref:Uncharacterized protein n=1 Tax=Shewanella submarina TaxID=2016376 RepID=A0ABV7GM86_9GAMM|nr:hypothetical protein [Shewanella submarina]MCL1036278.1 hypothetical protein [Shewanella submarina]
MNRHWKEFKDFGGVELNDTFVLSWGFQSDILTLNLLVSLWPESPHYEPPKEHEFTCYKEGKLIFHAVPSVEGFKPMEDVLPTEDPDGSVDYGSIDDLYEDGNGTWLIASDFGEFKFRSSGFDFTVAT